MFILLLFLIIFSVITFIRLNRLYKITKTQEEQILAMDNQIKQLIASQGFGA